jgi:Secretion system C-terminal sorting domain
MKKFKLLLLALVSTCSAAYGQPVPSVDGAWWKIAPQVPDVTPYNKAGHNTCDFTIYQDADGNWNAVACIRYTSYPGSTRFFHRWQSSSLTATNWTPKGLFWTTGTKDGPDALGRNFATSGYTTEGRLQAPHAFFYNNKYYMFHNNQGAYSLISNDGKTWTQHKSSAGAFKFFDMSRDVMIFNNKAVDNKFYGYFLQNVTGGADMVCRTAPTPEGPWSATFTPVRANGNSESPFVIKRGAWYYLFQQMQVIASQSPTDFNGNAIATLAQFRYAPEVLLVGGQYYLAAYSDGLWICKLKWSDASAVASTSVSAQNLKQDQHAEALSEISLYPNLVQDVINVTLPENETFHILIYDQEGRTAKTLTSTNTIESIDASLLHPGVYFVRISNGRHTKSFRIFKG